MMTTTANPDHPMTLEEIETRLREKYVAPKDGGKFVMGQQRRDGILLLLAKRKLPPEEWSKWLAENFSDGDGAEKNAELLIELFLTGWDYDLEKLLTEVCEKAGIPTESDRQGGHDHRGCSNSQTAKCPAEVGDCCDAEE